MRQVGSVLWPKLRILQLYGANTEVGKTIFSTILCQAFARQAFNVHYLKPVSTGALEDADDRQISSFAPGIHSRCLYQFAEPNTGLMPDLTDDAIQAAILEELRAYRKADEDSIVIVETAGGVLSPSPSGSSQADLYRPFRLPVLLVGDHKLGGIGATISSWESLHTRGYDVRSVALFEDERYDNHSYLRDYFAERDVHTFSLERPPQKNSNMEDDKKSMKAYYSDMSQDIGVMRFQEEFLQAHEQRIDRLKSMPREADNAIWHPFMQHKERSEDTIIAMDSAYGDWFQTYSTKQESLGSSQEDSLIKPAFDGSASWWTQGLGHGNHRLALAAAYAAGRYGHVMFAGAVHEPALTLAKTLINEMGNKRLSKVFFTDNGSTGMEVALKMALRAASIRNEWTSDMEILILGLKNSYHGDTIGTMDSSEPSVFNSKVTWYRGRGHWFDFPQVRMRQGKWLVEVPQELSEHLGQSREFVSLGQIFDFESRVEERTVYMTYFENELCRLKEEGKKLGALILEPILLGAGGMLFADPLFQRCLVDAVRNTGDLDSEGLDWSGMPVVFDEVFTGLYRLGRFSAASFLGVDPDIVVNAKLLTGGLVPLCTTTASESIFRAFLSNDKSDALLHGHSYTAHAIGANVANESLSLMTKMDSSGLWDGFRSDWTSTQTSDSLQPWSMWSQAFVASISHKSNVDHVFALGSVLVISLKDPSGSGYTSTAAAGLRDRLLSGSTGDQWVIHSRVLGNILYLMAALTTTPDTLLAAQNRVLDNL